jgi:PilZ domain
MFADRRNSKRRTLNRHAKIQVAGGALPRDCLISNISDGGVRLHVEGVDLPDRFVLLLADGTGSPRPRDCSVVWRLGYEVGAEFIDTFGRLARIDDTAHAGEATGA